MCQIPASPPLASRRLFLPPPQEPYEYHRLIRIGELLNRLGLPDAEMEYVGRRRGNFWEEEDENEIEDIGLGFMPSFEEIFDL